MDEGIAEHLAGTDLTTLALFSVTHRKDGTLAPNERGYKRIDGPIGQRLIAEAHDRGLRVELVYTILRPGEERCLLRRAGGQERTIAELVALADQDRGRWDQRRRRAARARARHCVRGVRRVAEDGPSRDERRRAGLRGNRREPRRDGDGPGGHSGGRRPDLHDGLRLSLGGLEPGASAPLDRRDGSEKDLAWSLDLYRDAGVPAERTILGLPLYGMSWPVTGPEIGAAKSGRGSVWIPSDNLAMLANPEAVPVFDPVEGVEHLADPRRRRMAGDLLRLAGEPHAEARPGR